MEDQARDSRAVASERPGHYIVGQLHGVMAGKPYSGNDGKEREPFVVKVVVVDEIVKVEYGSVAAAQAAVGVDTAPGDTVKLRVYLRTQEYKGKALLFFKGAGEPAVGR